MGRRSSFVLLGQPCCITTIAALTDLHAMLKKHGDWMELGSKDEKQETVEGTVEHWRVPPKIPSEAGMD